jgi:hypothetical protein
MFFSESSENFMPLHVRFALGSVPSRSELEGTGPNTRWKRYYMPPWAFVLHLLEVIAIIWCFFSIIYPTVISLYGSRRMLDSQFFPPTSDNIPFSSYELLESSMRKCLDSIEGFFTRSFQNFFFVAPDAPVVFKTAYRNGTTSTSTSINVNPSYFAHLNYFEIATDFMLMTLDMGYTGCTQWRLRFTVRVVHGSYLFVLAPGLDRDFCPAAVVESGPIVIHARPLTKPVSVLPTFQRRDLALFQPMARLGLCLVIASCVHLLLLIVRLGRAWQFHQEKLAVGHGDYVDLSFWKQFHEVIGFWEPLTLASSAFVLASSIFMLIDLGRITQFPSQQTVLVFGFGALLAVITGMRYLHYFPGMYSVVLVIRQAFLKLMLVAIGIAPIVFAFLFAGIFLFGLVSSVSESFLLMFEAVLSVTFGDVIARVYGFFTDGSEIYNVLSFLYATTLTALAMWLFFTSFTAEMVFVYKGKVTNLVDQSRKEKNTGPPVDGPGMVDTSW